MTFGGTLSPGRLPTAPADLHMDFSPSHGAQGQPLQGWSHGALGHLIIGKQWERRLAARPGLLTSQDRPCGQCCSPSWLELGSEEGQLGTQSRILASGHFTSPVDGSPGPQLPGPKGNPGLPV